MVRMRSALGWLAALLGHGKASLWPRDKSPDPVYT
jgi:hypothetical protein